ncbi:hypothetical protein J31TS4_10780 [Paenibacillus sp. J31TS4]|uniref:WD40/YVTN/BNR-like repeat-containing protein n=1 Tax=Paenibacillus sp. J31TS4 TaxID=2807195 RepID=UPI001B272585|nr:hypothetical protein [Paenibacillus sp. J31TS4]GIP37798.1 hypothetical protein J31TS4_10780 [Paenibacillus sp. J31TS4]
MNNRRAYRRLAALLLAVPLAAASGCGSDGPPPAAAESPSPSGTPAASASPAPSGTAQGESKPAASQPAPAQIQARLTGLRAVDDQVAYAWGKSAAGQLRLYRTEDAGGSWLEVTPPGLPALTTDPGDHDLTVVDKNTAVYLSGMSARPMTIAVTADGGRTWKQGKVPYPEEGGDHLAFVTPAHGFLLHDSGAAMGSSAKQLYETKDGGLTWNQVMDNRPLMEQAGPEDNGPLPLGGFAQYGITFRDGTNGWVPHESRTPGKVRLYRTKDAGRNWQPVPLEVSSNDPNGQPQITGAPVFFGGDRKTGWMPYEFRGQDRVQLGGYFTTDGGETWKLISFGKTTDVLPTLQSPHVTFIDSSEGWLWNGANLLHTDDQGGSWSPLTGNTVFRDTLRSYPYLIDLQFVTQKTGWALARNEAGDGSRLLRTQDGGKTWRVM